MKRSKIEWTDYSGEEANFVWRGANFEDCKCSPGCAHCYVDRVISRAHGNWPPVTTVFPGKLKTLLNKKFNKPKVPYRRGPGSHPMVFVCDTGDLFHDNVPDRFIDRAISGFIARHDVDWQILTKRSARMVKFVYEYCGRHSLCSLPRNIWLGVTAEDQEHFDVRVTDHLMQAPATTKWVSIEPMLGPVCINWGHLDWGRRLNWVVVGGESGSFARPMALEWARGIRESCLGRIPFFFKQWGRWRPTQSADEARLFNQMSKGTTTTISSCYLTYYAIGRKLASLLDGKEHREYP